MKSFALCSAALLCLTAAVLCGILAYQAWVLPPRVSVDLGRRLDAVQASVDATRADLAKTQADLVAVVRIMPPIADRQLAGIRRDVNARAVQLQATADQLAADVRPVLAETAATVKDTRDTMDALYPDLNAAVQTFNVTNRSIAETAHAIELAAPKQAQATAELTSQAAGIAADVHKITTAITKPKRWWQRVLGPVYAAARIGAAIF